MTQIDNDRQIEILAKLGEITQTAIEWADLYDEEDQKEQWNRTNPTKPKSTVTARTVAAANLQKIRQLVKELHSL